MALLRLRNEAECLTSQLTKQNLGGQPTADARSKPPLPRERFSPLARYRPVHSRPFKVGIIFCDSWSQQHKKRCCLRSNRRPCSMLHIANIGFMSFSKHKRRLGQIRHGCRESFDRNLFRPIEPSLVYQIGSRKCLLLKLKCNVVIALRLAHCFWLHSEKTKRGNELEKNVMKRLFGVHGIRG